MGKAGIRNEGIIMGWADPGGLHGRGEASAGQDRSDGGHSDLCLGSN